MKIPQTLDEFVTAYGEHDDLRDWMLEGDPSIMYDILTEAIRLHARVLELEAENARLEAHNKHLMSELDRVFVTRRGYDFHDFMVCPHCRGDGFTESSSVNTGYRQSDCERCDTIGIVKREKENANN